MNILLCAVCKENCDKGPSRRLVMPEPDSSDFFLVSLTVYGLGQNYGREETSLKNAPATKSRARNTLWELKAYLWLSVTLSRTKAVTHKSGKFPTSWIAQIMYGWKKTYSSPQSTTVPSFTATILTHSYSWAKMYSQQTGENSKFLPASNLKLAVVLV